MPPVVINLLVNAENLEALDQAAAGLQAINSAAEGGGSSGDGGIFGSIISGAADAYGAIQIVTGVLSQAGGFIDSISQIGTESVRSKAALDALSGGQASQFLSGMTEATKGAVSQLTLAQAATQALSAGVAKNSNDLSTIARDGQVLGEIFENSATQGISDFTRVLEQVGSTRALKTLGLDAVTVTDEFDRLKKSGMDAADAWKTSVLDDAATKVATLGITADTTRNQVDVLTQHWQDLVAKVAEPLAASINVTIDWFGSGGGNKPDTPGSVINNAATPPKAGVPMQMGADGQMHPVDVGSADYNKAQYDPYSSVFSPADSYPKAPMAGNLTVPNLSAASGQGRGSSLQYNIDQAYGAANGIDPNTGLAVSTAKPQQQGPDASGYLAEVAAETSAASQAKQNISDQAAGTALLKAGWQDITGKVQEYTNSIREGITPITEQIAQMKNYQTLQEAFDTTNGGIAGQIGGQLGTDAQYLEGKATGGKKAAVTDADKQVIDDYRIASGQATVQSIAFENAQASLSEKVRGGQMSLAEESKELLAMATAAKEGNTSITALDDILYSGGQHTTVKSKRGGAQGDDGDPIAGASSQAKDDPFVTQKASADEYKKKVAAIGTEFISNIGKAVQSGVGTLLGLTPANVGVSTLTNNISTASLNMEKLPLTALISGTGMSIGMIPAELKMVDLNNHLVNIDTMLTKLSNRTINITANINGNGVNQLGITH